MSQGEGTAAGQDGDTEWRLLPLVVGNAAIHLARTQALLESVGAGRARPAVCFERWESTGLILGASQRGSDVDAGVCRQRGVEVARRLAGGLAVYASPEYLSVTIVAPAGHRLVRGDILAAYHRLGAPIVDALVTLGLDASLLPLARARAERSARPPSSLCYGGLSPYEVMIGSRKLVGVAQVRRFGAVAYVGGLYRTLDTAAHVSCLAGDVETRANEAQLLARATVDLRALGAAALFEHIPGAIATAFSARCEQRLVPGDLDAEELARQADLSRGRYADAGWTWRR